VAEVGVFPLALTLVPTERVPLHIFEPRYKELVAECIETNQPFALLFEDDTGRREIGTLAAVAEVLHMFDDGRMNILAEGRSRFRVLSWTTGRSFATAEIEAYDDEPHGDDTAELGARSIELFRQLASVAEADVSDPDGASGSLAFEIAAHVDFGHAPKQELLEIRSEHRRLERLIELLTHALELVSREREVARRASSNGRVSHG
jgi:ATP-dependent Lon protease